MSQNPLGEVVRPPTLTAATAFKLREAILSGSLPPGSPLREGELTHSLGVSRGTVREALRLLQEEGLVELLPHRGAFVMRLTPSKVREISTLRALLESYAVRVALENKAFSSDDLAQLEVMVEQLGKYQDGEIPETVRTDMQFHHLMCERSGHQLLLDVLARLQSLHMLFILTTKLYGSDMTGDEATHRAVLAAVREGDPQRGAEVVRAHVLQSAEWLLGRMDEGDWRSINAS